LGPTLSICGLLFGTKLLINARTFDVGILISAETLGPKVCKLASQILMVSFFFQPWGQYKATKVQHLLVTWGRFKIFFSISALTCSVKPLGLISTFALIGMLGFELNIGLDSLCPSGLRSRDTFSKPKPRIYFVEDWEPKVCETKSETILNLLS
jgi:hypothetical protein